MKAKENLILLIFAVFVTALVYFVMYEVNKLKPDLNKEKTLKQINDSLVKELNVKQKYIEIQDSIYTSTAQKDSVRLYSIDKSIKTIYHELKNQTQHTFSIPDSSFAQYIHSIRANGGFYQIQY